MPVLNDILAERLERVEKSAQRRELTVQEHESGPYVTRGGVRYLHFSGNDYLGLRTHPAVVRAALDATEATGAGSGASRLVTGNHPYYPALEEALAEAKHTQAALVFGSGYLANSGTIAALMGEGDLILADRLIHACMLDGVRLSGAALKRFAHNDTAHLAALLAEHREKYTNCLILTESVFSMDGDRAPLADIHALAQVHDAWFMVDDAHGLGFVETIPADIVSGTLSKALGSYGGYVAGSGVLRDYLINHARSLIFSTGLPPAAVASAHAALMIMQAEPERAQSVIAKATRVSEALGLGMAQGPIIPYIVGESGAALEASRKLAAEGIWVQAIRPPTVPPATARLRITMTATHTDEEVECLIQALGKQAI